jgi:ketosteroid isomerase-like protein
MGSDAADAVALRSLADRYAQAVDRRDAAALLALFAPGAVVVLPPPMARRLPSAELVGHGQIATLIDGVRNFVRTRHVVTQQVVDVRGDTASGEIYCEAHHILGSDERIRDLVLALRYLDSFARVDAGWRFTRRELVLDWTSRHDVRWDF